jgi:hypothetical protein
LRPYVSLSGAKNTGPKQSWYWTDQTRSDLGTGPVDLTGSDPLAELPDPDQIQIYVVPVFSMGR